MNQLIKTLSIAILLFSTALVFQNCSPGDYSTQGNGVPYEGEIPGGDTGSVGLGNVLDDPSAPGDSDNPGEPLPAGGAGQNPLPLDNVDFVCTSTISNVVDTIQFGSDSRGDQVRFFAINGDLLIRDRDPTESEVIFNQYLNSGEIIDKVSVSGSNVFVKYYDLNNIYITEMILCE